MADLSPAEILLDSLVPAQRLIRRLQAVLAAPFPYKGIDLSQPTKAKIAAFQSAIQSRIDELTAQREKAVEFLRMRLIGLNSCDKLYMEIQAVERNVC